MKDRDMIVNSDESLARYIERVKQLYSEHKYLVFNYRLGTESSLSQKAIFHIWLKQWLAHIWKQPEEEITKQELEEFKKRVKMQCYVEQGYPFLIKMIKNKAHPSSMTKWEPGQTFLVLEWMQNKAAETGCLLKSSGEFRALKSHL